VKTGTLPSENGTPIEHLDGIPAALAVVRHGSASAAAKHMRVGVATVLRRLERLEAELGCSLFDRVQSGMRPTPAMEHVLPVFERVEASCLAVRREIAGLEPRPAGVVRLASLPVVGATVLVPDLPTLHERYPELTLELLPASAVVDLDGRQADLALRTFRPVAGDLVAKQVARFAIGAYGSARLAVTLAERAPASWPWLDWTEDLGPQPESAWLRSVVPQPRIVFRSSGLDALLGAAVAGLGVTAVAAPLAESRGLVPLPMPGPAPEGSLYVVTHRALRHAPRVATVWDWVVERFAAGEVAPR
jgi:DNA-binding transcriptional LysR family regulator